MHRLIHGLKRFQNHYFNRHRQHFMQLTQGQSPHTLFITCSDSRICPTHMTDSTMGELFVLRNAGNFIPAYDKNSSTHEAVTLEYGVLQLGIKEIVVCGHQSCGAMMGILNPQALGHLPITQRKLSEYANIYSDTPSFLAYSNTKTEGAEKERLEHMIKLNVVYQIRNLLTYPFVRERFEKGQLEIFGWVFSIEEGDLSFGVDVRELCLEEEYQNFVMPTSHFPERKLNAHQPQAKGVEL